MEDLLFLTQRIPYPPVKGDKIRSYNILRHLCERYRVHLGCFIDDKDDWRHLPFLQTMVADACVLPLARRAATLKSLIGVFTGEPLSLPFYRDWRMARWVTKVLTGVRPQVAFVFSSSMAQYIVGRSSRPPRFVMDFVDVDSQKWRQYADRKRWPMAAVYRRESHFLLEYERKIAELADATVFVSEPEAQHFRSLTSPTAGRVWAIGNGVDAQFHSSAHAFPSPFRPGTEALVFTGAMDYWPNIEGADWFARNVLPLVQATVPNAHFWVVGSNPAPAVDALAELGNVTVTGRVDDVRPYLAHARVVVAPVLTAQGIQNKVLEGMAMARPVVATPQAQEGLLAQNGLHLRIGESAEDFASAVIDMLTDPARASALGQAARRQVVELYDWPSRFAEWDDLLASLPHCEPGRVSSRSTVDSA